MDLFDSKYLSLPAQVQKNKDDIETLQQSTLNLENSKGEWSNTVQYNPGDIVSYRGGSFFARQQSTGQEPPYNEPTGSNVYWQIIALSGPPGETGAAGPQGPQGPAGEDGIGFNTLTNVEFEIESVVYDSGIATLSGTVTFQETGESFQVPVSLPIPIAAGSGITIDADEAGTGIEISAEGGGATNPYPVGAIYMSVESTNPSTLFGGTWQQIQDTFLLAAGPSHAAGTTGGEEAHVLTKNEMPAHTHTVPVTASDTALGDDPNYPFLHHADSGIFNTKSSSEGGGAAHNNMPPFLTVYIWKRVS